MRWNVLEIAHNDRYLKLFRGFAVVMERDNELGRVTLDELCCVIVSAEQATVSKALLVRLAELGVPLVVCGSNYLPISITLPLSAHYHSRGVLELQISVSQPLKKRLWQQLVKLKIQHQTAVLRCNKPTQKAAASQLKRMSQQVTSGDSKNHEAQAARLYWQSLMGRQFRRQQKSEDIINSALNYGYAIIRAACARAIVAAGLNPSLGLHHKNMLNSFCLADDIMEIYRPLVDNQVVQTQFEQTLTTEDKRRLAKILQLDIKLGDTTTTVNTSMASVAVSLVQSLKLGTNQLCLPELILETNTPTSAITG